MPQKIGPYLVEKELGHGAHGRVFLARRKGDPQQARVALKLVEIQDSPDRTLIEPQVLYHLQHPGINRLIDFFQCDDDVALVLEYVDGTTLSAYVDQRGRLSPVEVLRFLRQMASALQYAHERHILHRDIKPANILLTGAGESPRFILADFGVSKVARTVELAKRTAGTRAYMAPEQLQGRPTPQSDLWSLGVVAFYLLEGRLPFQGSDSDELVRQILYAAPRLSRVGEGGLTAEVGAVILRLLEKEPIHRIDSAAALAAELDRLDSGLREPTRREPVVAQKTTYRQRLEQSYSQYWRSFWLVMLLGVVPRGVIGSGLQLLGMFFIYRAYTERRQSRTRESSLGLLCVAAGFAGNIWLGVLADEWGTMLTPLFPALRWRAALVWEFLIDAASIYCLAKAREFKRSMFVSDSLSRHAPGSTEFLAALRGQVDICDGDSAVHLRYAEALYAAGRVSEAIVEATLITDRDAYNITANLLIARGLSSLYLWRDCQRVCEKMLSVIGYSHEFLELKQRSTLALEA